VTRTDERQTAGTFDVQLLRLAEFAHEGIAVFGRAEGVLHQAGRGRDAVAEICRHPSMAPKLSIAGILAALTADKTGANVAEVRRQAEQQFAAINLPTGICSE
jgi:hypothetical protein